MRSAANYINGAVHDSLFVRVIRGRWGRTSVSRRHSITCRTGKKDGRKQEKLMTRKHIGSNKSLNSQRVL
jgi:hypothetical protein